MSETVYVLTNQSMPGIVKIGRTSGPILDRVKSPDNTSLPLSFECFSAWEVADAAGAERALHLAFGDHRLREKREFFRLSPDQPTAILKAFGIRNVTPGEDAVLDEDDKKSLDRARSRRINFSFDMISVKPGAELQSVFDPETVCYVHDKRKVLFRGQILSLSAAAMVVARENGKNWTSLAGPAYWLYDDVTLSDWRNEADFEDEDV